MRIFFRAALPAALCALTACSSSPTLTIQGSDTEVQLVSALAEEFTKDHEDASISVAGGGSAVGLAALLNGETDIANSSRMMKDEERATAKDKGLDVQEFTLAIDGLSIVVHPENPLVSLGMADIGRIFKGEVTNWKDVGGPDAGIVLYGRQSTSGTFGFFRDTVVKDDYATSMRQMEGSQAIVDAVAADTNGIGYVGVGYVKTAEGTPRTDLKILPVSPADGGEPVSPLETEAVKDGSYPIARRIYQYLGAKPEAGSLTHMFLTFEMSDAGQTIVQNAGFYSLAPADIARNEAILGAAR